MMGQPLVLVTGATGTVGRQVTAQLLAAGSRVRALLHGRGPAGLPGGVELVRGDLTSPDSLAAAADGADRVFFVWPLTAPGALAALAPQAVRALAGQGRGIVYLSAAAAAGNPESPWARMERIVERTAARWTFLRPTGFAKNTLLWAGQIRASEVVRWPYAAAARALIHEADIAAVAVLTLTGNGQHVGRAYHLTGPQTLTHAQQVHVIGEAIGRPLRFQEVSAAAVRPWLATTLGDEAFADGALASWERFVAEPEAVTQAVLEITGTGARSLREWARDHAADFR